MSYEIRKQSDRKLKKSYDGIPDKAKIDKAMGSSNGTPGKTEYTNLGYHELRKAFIRESDQPNDTHLDQAETQTSDFEALSTTSTSDTAIARSDLDAHFLNSLKLRNTQEHYEKLQEKIRVISDVRGPIPFAAAKNLAKAIDELRKLEGQPLSPARPTLQPAGPGPTVMLPAEEKAKNFADTIATISLLIPTPPGIMGPARFIPEHPGAFLERGFFNTTDDITYLVRVGPPGGYGDYLFSSISDAKSYAHQLAKIGEDAIRNKSSLPLIWPGGDPGNPVKIANVYEVSAGAAYIQGVVGPQLEGGTVYGLPKIYPGGGPQVQIERIAKLKHVASYPVEIQIHK